MDDMTMRIGFIGLGRLGAQLVDRLLEIEFEALTLYDIDEKATARYRDTGATLARSVGEVASGALDLIGICVQDDAQVEEVVAALLAESLPAGTIIAVHATVHPATCRRLAADTAAVGVNLVDAAISNGGRAPGATPTRVVLFGGDGATFRRCRPYLEGLGDVVEHVGELGSGQVLKLLNNLLMILNMGTTDTVMRCGKQLGIAEDVMTRSLSTGSGSSQGIRTLLGSERAAHNDIVLGKDLRLALDVVAAGGCETGPMQLAGEAALLALAERAAGAGAPIAANS